MKGRDWFLDHDILIDRYYNIHQVIGNFHPPGIIYSIKKYILKKYLLTPWYRTRIKYYSRTFKEYRPSTSNIGDQFYYSPIQKSLFPSIKKDKILYHLKPEEAVNRIIQKIGDPLEKIVLELITELVNIGIPISKLGISGSILAQIHNPMQSDIDLVLYDCKYLIPELNTIYKAFDKFFLREWIIHNSKRIGVPIEVVKRLYNPIKRGVYKGKMLSIIPVYPRPKKPLYKETYLGEIEALVELTNETCEHHYYPHELKGIILEVLKGKKEFSGYPIIIESYEGLYSNIPDITEKAIVKGAGFISGDKIVLVVGIRERKSFVKPII